MERKACVGVVNNSPLLPPQAWVNTPLVSLKWDGWSYPGLNTSRFILLLLLRVELKWRLRLLTSSLPLSHTHTHTHTHTQFLSLAVAVARAADIINNEAVCLRLMC